MLFGALMDNPYAYYQVLRWIIAGVMGYSAYLAYEQKRIVWIWIFGVIAILYNPIAPIYLARGTWMGIDLIVAVIIFISLIQFKKQ